MVDWIPDPVSDADGSHVVSVWWFRQRLARMIVEGQPPGFCRTWFTMVSLFGPNFHAVDPGALLSDEEADRIESVWGDLESTRRLTLETLLEDVERLGFMKRLPSGDPESIAFRASDAWRGGAA